MMMYWGNNWDGVGGWSMIGGGILMLIFWAVIIGFVIWLIMWLINQNNKNQHNENSHSLDNQALEILKKRYAQGEIDKKEYLEKKEDLK